MLKVITFGLFAATVVQCLTEEQMQMLNKRREECVQESKLPPGSLEKLAKGDWSAETEEMKRFAFCMLVKSDLMSPVGVVKMDVALSKVEEADRPMVEKMIDECLKNRSDKPYETAWNYLKCYHSKNPKYSII